MDGNKDQSLETNEFDEFLTDLEPLPVAAEEPSTENASIPSESAAEIEVENKDVPETSNTPDTEEDEVTTLRKQNQALLEQLGKAYQENSTPAPVVTETPTTESSSTDDPFGGLTFDQIIENEDSFKKFLGDFAKKVVANAEERLLQKLPVTVSKLTAEQLETRKAVDTFYAEHSQLAEVKPFVAKVVSVVASEHADWDLQQVLNESADRAYKALGLKKQAVTPDNGGTKKPAFASPAKGLRGEAAATQKSKLEKELEELMDL